jgi:hypothetical protein
VIAVTMSYRRFPGSSHEELYVVTFEEPHWSAAKDLIRTLESQGWTFVRMVNLDKPETDRIEAPTDSIDGRVS